VSLSGIFLAKKKQTKGDEVQEKDDSWQTKSENDGVLRKDSKQFKNSASGT
jgi:hypothetical protein